MNESGYSDLEQSRLDVCAYRLDEKVNAELFVDAIGKFEQAIRRDERSKCAEDKQ